MDPRTQAQFFLRTRVRFGNGLFETAGAEAAALGRTVMVVTGRSAMRRTGLTERLSAQLERAGARVVLYEEASPNPTTAEVDAGVALARREKVEALVGLGGGSAMDVAKAVAMAAVYGKPCYELCGVPLPERGLPVVAVPTTAGTGAEVAGVAVVTEAARKHKTALKSPWVSPEVAVVDPELTRTLPPEVTASSGMDALAHAVEAYLSKNATLFSELFAIRATTLVFEHLAAACERGDDLSARTGMAMASLLAGVTISQAGTNLGHGLGMALGGLFGTDHGATVGLALPHLLEFGRPVFGPRIAELARAAGLAGPDQNDDEAAAGFTQEVRELLGKVPLPRDVEGLGCDFSDPSRVAEATLRQGATANYPVALSLAEVEAFVRRVGGLWA